MPSRHAAPSMLRRLLPGVLIAVCLAGAMVPYAAARETPREEITRVLIHGDFADKIAIIDALVAHGGAPALTMLQALLGGDLYTRKREDQLVYLEKAGKDYDLRDAFTGAPAGQVSSKRRVAKIRINNQIRGRLRDGIAELGLFSEDPQARLAAARALVTSGRPGIEAKFAQALSQEADDGVRAALQMGLATLAINNPDPATRLAAIKRLGGSDDPQVRAMLAGLLSGEDGTTLDAETQAAAKAALGRIDGRRQLFTVINNVFFGLSLGSVLFIAAVGLAITFGVMGVINMAHGEMIMLGAYTTFVVQQLFPDLLGWSLLIALPLAFLVSGAVGIVIERTVIRVLYGRPLETLLATFGLSLMIQQAVRLIFSPLNRAVSNPAWMSGALEINPMLSFTYNRLYIIVFSAMVMALLLMLLRYTSFGLQVRAVTQNRSMASAMGIRTDWVDALTFGLGSGIAGIAGVALSQLTNVGPNLGQDYIVDSFMVVVFGGVGNLWGTLLGATMLGVVNKFLEPFSGAVLAKILVLVFIILFIQRRPRGLIALRGRAAEA